MINCSNSQCEDDDSLMEFKRRALRDAVICIGWLKLISVLYYVCMYYLVHVYSKGDVSTILQVMLLLAIPVQIIHGIVLFFGALEDKLLALEVAVWLCLIIASYNTVLGTVGCIYFVRTGFANVHFLLAFAFVMLAFALFTVLCHDVLMVYAYKQMVLRVTELDNLKNFQCHSVNSTKLC